MTVFLKHPFKKEPPIEVDETKIVPYMVEGYVQVAKPIKAQQEVK